MKYDPTLPLHLVAIAILFVFFIGLRIGISRAARRKRGEERAIWKREQAKLPRAYPR
jgi:hypothetical protein